MSAILDQNYGENRLGAFKDLGIDTGMPSSNQTSFDGIGSGLLGTSDKEEVSPADPKEKKKKSK